MRKIGELETEWSAAETALRDLHALDTARDSVPHVTAKLHEALGELAEAVRAARKYLDAVEATASSMAERDLAASAR